MELLGNSTTKLPSIINDPFNKNCVIRISVVYRKNTFSDKWIAEGNVSFKNNGTDGTQSFEGKDFNDVTLQIKNFLESLNP